MAESRSTDTPAGWHRMTVDEVQRAFPDLDVEAQMAAAADRVIAERARLADDAHRAAS